MTQRRSFTVRGIRNGSHVHVTWSEGDLSGDFPTVDLVELEAELAALSPGTRNSVSEVFYASEEMQSDPLKSPLLAWHLIRTVIDNITSVEGDAPPEAIKG